MFIGHEPIDIVKSTSVSFLDYVDLRLEMTSFLWTWHRFQSKLNQSQLASSECNLGRNALIRDAALLHVLGLRLVPVIQATVCTGYSGYTSKSELNCVPGGFDLWTALD